ncbi:RNA polymerase subunit sigma-70 [Arthrobacter pityocampae]|uniref:RNA polymerase subunit sigma-70 n=1 Tax=Arthrobacter pityocampae TaxID=547334 RepID=A0A2S5J211_9MICC|nr:RNA polymerase subunit sigma-70 [Arthrobacter pityocampae]
MASDRTASQPESSRGYAPASGPESERGAGPRAGSVQCTSRAAPAIGAPGHQAGAGPALHDLDQATIVARAQNGDVSAFEWLLSAHEGGVFRLALRMLGDRAEAEDIVQETFIAARRSLPDLAAPQSFIPWLYRVATNKCFNLLRSRRRHPAHPDAFDDGSVPAGSHDAFAWGEADPRHQGDTCGGLCQDPALRYEAEAQMRALTGLLQAVPAGPRACWLLRDVHEFSYTEIATIVHLPESTVRGRIARARRILAEGMQSWR